MRVRAVFLDLDGTLLDYGDARWADTVRAVCTTLAVAGAGLDPDALFTAYTAISSQYFRAAGSQTTGSQTTGSQAAGGPAAERSLWSRALATCGCPDGTVADSALAAYASERAAATSSSLTCGRRPWPSCASGLTPSC
jgi:hypothetical protein